MRISPIQNYNLIKRQSFCSNHGKIDADLLVIAVNKVREKEDCNISAQEIDNNDETYCRDVLSDDKIPCKSFYMLKPEEEGKSSSS